MKSMKITFLGTAAMQPTPERSTTAILISHKNENILIDCGEGTQRQLKIAGIKLTKITKILISHWHGDHVFGLPGLISTMGASEYSKTLEIYGPKGTKKYMKKLSKTFIPKDKVKIKVKEIKKSGQFLETKELVFQTTDLKHSCPTRGYVIKEKDKRKMNISYLKKFGLTRDPILGKLQSGKDIVHKGRKILVKEATTLIPGKKISIILDSTQTPKIIEFVKNSDILIMESTFDSKLKEKARKYKHTTAKQAAETAKKSKSKKLILTHIGKRYNSSTPLVKEAKKVFPKTMAAKDFMTISL
jgi:ribonuclease Z